MNDFSDVVNMLCNSPGTTLEIQVAIKEVQH